VIRDKGRAKKSVSSLVPYHSSLIPNFELSFGKMLLSNYHILRNLLEKQ